ncbi:MAG: hypothetical protein KDI55_00345 [Anaerolineae bacterium]|nr:hypothetical protein [Anaerolineae bacterium]
MTNCGTRKVRVERVPAGRLVSVVRLRLEHRRVSLEFRLIERQLHQDSQMAGMVDRVRPLRLAMAREAAWFRRRLERLLHMRQALVMRRAAHLQRQGMVPDLLGQMIQKRQGPTTA